VRVLAAETERPGAVRAARACSCSALLRERNRNVAESQSLIRFLSRNMQGGKAHTVYVLELRDALTGELVCPEISRRYSEFHQLRKDVSRAFPSCVRSVVTEIYLCHVCSCYEIEYGNAAAGAPRPGRPPAAQRRRARPLPGQDQPAGQEQHEGDGAAARGAAVLDVRELRLFDPTPFAPTPFDPTPFSPNALSPNSPHCRAVAGARCSRSRGAAGATRVSRSCACIGSPCLRRRVHGALIGVIVGAMLHAWCGAPTPQKPGGGDSPPPAAGDAINIDSGGDPAGSSPIMSAPPSATRQQLEFDATTSVHRYR
jgi:hypothetical protein